MNSARTNDGDIELDSFTKCAVVETDLNLRPLEHRRGGTTGCIGGRCGICLLVSALIGVSYVAYVTLGGSSPQLSFVDGFGGTSTEELSSGKDSQLVAEGTTPLSPHPHTTTSTSSSTHAAAIQEWLNAKVTLNDGIKYEVVQQLSHDKSSFTEGLTFANGKLYESIGLYQESALLELDPETGQTLASIPMPSSVFGEGLTYFRGKFVQLTYKKRIGYIYDAHNLAAPPTTFSFDTTTHEGWGMTYDEENHELIVSDGSAYLLIWDPDTLEEKRKVLVKLLNGKKAHNINELEFWRGRVLANVWFQDTLLVINPLNGFVEKEYDFSDLWSKSERRRSGADVLNGISVSKDEDVIYMTGKNWDRMFRIRLLY